MLLSKDPYAAPLCVQMLPCRFETPHSTRSPITPGPGKPTQSYACACSYGELSGAE